MRATIVERDGAEIRVEDGQGRITRIERRERYWQVWLVELGRPDHEVHAWADTRDPELAGVLHIGRRPEVLQTPADFRVEVRRREGVDPSIPFTDLDPSDTRRVLVFFNLFSEGGRPRPPLPEGGMVVADVRSGIPRPGGAPDPTPATEAPDEPDVDEPMTVTLSVADRDAWAPLLVYAHHTGNEALTDAVVREIARVVQEATKAHSDGMAGGAT